MIVFRHGRAFRSKGLIKHLRRLCTEHHLEAQHIKDDDSMLDTCVEISFATESPDVFEGELPSAMEQTILAYQNEEWPSYSKMRIDKVSASALCAWLCFAPPLDSMHEIRPRLWLGDVEALDNMQSLLKHNIRWNINLSCRQPEWHSNSRKQHQSIDSRMIHILDDKHADLLQHLDDCRIYIRDAIASGDGILVNCMQGKSRSASIVIDYLMQSEGMTFEEAHDLVRSKRPCIKPNRGFRHQLRTRQLLSSSKQKV